jgi:hypothetical protein
LELHGRPGLEASGAIVPAAPDRCRADAATTGGAGTDGDDHREEARKERDRRHRQRAEPQACGRLGGLDDLYALLPLLLGKFDDAFRSPDRGNALLAQHSIDFRGLIV